LIKKIYVYCIETTETTKSPQSEEILCRVEKGEEFKVTLDEDTDQYFTTDSQGRKVYVGYRDIEGTIYISDEFRLMGISQNGFNYVYANVDLIRTL
jgi:hypothetical protein